MTEAASTDKKYNYRLSSIFFYGGLVCEIVSSFSGYMYGSSLMPYIIMLGMGFFGLSIVFTMDWKNVKEWLIVGVVLAYGLVSYYFHHGAYVLRICLLVLAQRGLNIRFAERHSVRNTVKVFLYGTLTIMIAGALISVLGFGNSFTLTGVFRNTEEIRYTFGFIHPNGFALFMFRLYVMIVYCYGERLKPIGVAIVSSVGLGLQYLSNSKAGIGMIAIVFMVYLFDYYCRKDFKYYLYEIGNYLILALEAFLVCWAWFPCIARIPFLHDHWPFVNDKLTTGRLLNIRRNMRELVPSFFGVGHTMSTSEIGYVDSLFSEGILFLVLYIILLVVLIVRLRKKKDSAGLILVMGMIAYSFAESFIFAANRNLVWLIL